jgi:hypothetical protein
MRVCEINRTLGTVGAFRPNRQEAGEMIVLTVRRTQTGEVVETETFQDLNHLYQDLANTATLEYGHALLSALEGGATSVSMYNGRYHHDTYEVVTNPGPPDPNRPKFDDRAHTPQGRYMPNK